MTNVWVRYIDFSKSISSVTVQSAFNNIKRNSNSKSRDKVKTELLKSSFIDHSGSKLLSLICAELTI